MRAAVLLPWAIPPLTSVMTWRFLFSDTTNVLNYLLIKARLIESAIPWLGVAAWAMPAVLIVNIWRGFPFFAITLLAGLAAIPRDLYDVAEVDGADWFQRFRHVTLPGLMPVMIVSLALSGLWTFNEFPSIWLLTFGGPGAATTTLPIASYLEAFVSGTRSLSTAVMYSLLPLPLFVGLIWMLKPNDVSPGAKRGMMKLGTRRLRQVRRLVGGAWMLAVLAFALFPVYWIVLASFKQPRDLMAPTPQFWLHRPVLSNYANLFNEPYLKFGRLTINSAVVTVGGTLLSLAVALPAAFALTRLRFPGRGVVGMSVFFVYLVPATLLFLPLYALAASLGLQDTRLGLTLVYTSFNTPFCIWMLRGYLMSIPMELEESAMIDGCSRPGAWLRVILPLIGPGLAATAIFGFTLAWSEFLYAYVLTETAASRTMPVGLASFIQLDMYHWDELSAGAVVMALPVILIYAFCQRFIVSGLTGGAVKG